MYSVPKPLKSALFCSLLIFLPGSTALAEEPEVFEFDSYKDVVQLFDKLGYTEAAWDLSLIHISEPTRQLTQTRMPT